MIHITNIAVDDITDVDVNDNVVTIRDKHSSVHLLIADSINGRKIANAISKASSWIK